MLTDKPWDKPQFTTNISKLKVNQLDLNLIKPPRGGVILYTKVNNQLFFGLGVDRQSGQLTDFGGGISYHRDKNVIEGALREFNEETLNLFQFNVNHVMDSVALYNINMLIIFKLIEEANWREQFLDLVNKEVDPEVNDLTWLSLSEFKNVIKTRGPLFFRVQNFLQKAGDFFWLL